MAGELSTYLGGRVDELCERVMARLVSWPEFRVEPAQVRAEVQACLRGLLRADDQADATVLARLALAMGRGDPQPTHGYRRVQRVLEAVCAETSDLLHRDLPVDASRLARVRMRALMGPAQLGLARMFTPEPPVTTPAG